MIRKIFSIFNLHTIVIVAEAVAVYFLFKHIDLKMSVNFDIISIAIIFPLVFTIRGAFRRREKALEHLSRFRSSLKTVENLINMNANLTEKEKLTVMSLVKETNHGLYDYLETSSEDSTDFDKKFGQRTLRLAFSIDNQKVIEAVIKLKNWFKNNY